MTFRMKLIVGTGALLSFAGGVALASGPAARPPAPEVKKHAAQGHQH